MSPTLQKISEWHHVDGKTFENEILTQYRPAVLRGFINAWPAVQQALQSAESVCKYVMNFDNGNVVDAILLPPDKQGRIFYRDDMNGFNFVRNKLPVSAIIEQLARYSHFTTSPAVAVQSALITDCLPGFSSENKLAVLDDKILPRIWIGNRIITPAHFDQSNNIACVVSGRRRFTLFPPEQVANLYIGPLDFAPTPTPISMVSFKNPDFQRFPRFKEALAAAQVVELGPGDALYIPALWWHHVESLDLFNILVNYWWGEPAPAAIKTGSPFECLLHCVRNMKDMAPEQKTAWAALFARHVFNTENDPGQHISEHMRGVLTWVETGNEHDKLR